VTKTFLPLALLLLALADSSIAQEPDLFPVDKNGKTGYIDHNGKLIIPFKFDEARGFSEGLAPVRIGEDWGYIDASGKIVVKPRFFQASAFSEGFAAVGVYFPRKKSIDSKVGYYNYIDRNGNLLSNEHLAVAFDFSEGLADVMNDDDNRHFFIDKTGRHVFEFFAYEKEFKNGRVLFKTEGNMPESRTGYIDNTGKIVISAQFHGGENFSEGLACVYNEKGAGYIDTNGNIAIDFKFDNCSSFSEGLASILVNGLVGFIDKSGKIVIQPQFAWNPGKETRFSDGIAVVKVGESEKPTEDGLRDVTISSQGNIYAAKSGLFGVIDTSGKFIIPPKYVQIGDFHYGLAWVNLSDSYIIHGDTDRWGYINKQGKIVWKSF